MFNRLPPGCCLFPNAIIHISEHSLDLDSDTAALFLYGVWIPRKGPSRALIAQLPGAGNRFVARRPRHISSRRRDDGGKRFAL